MSRCGTCGAELVEVERWTMSVEDMEATARAQVGRALTAGERARFREYVGEGSVWRQVVCPTDPAHVGFLTERVA